MSEVTALFVLTHEYSDKSGFTVCGVTSNLNVAFAWYRANDENNVYDTFLDIPAVNWQDGIKGWQEIHR